MKFEEYMSESSDSTNLHVLLHSQSQQSHKGGGKEIAKAHGGEWKSFYDASTKKQAHTVHVISVPKHKADSVKASLEKHKDVNHVHISHESGKVLANQAIKENYMSEAAPTEKSHQTLAREHKTEAKKHEEGTPEHHSSMANHHREMANHFEKQASSAPSIYAKAKEENKADVHYQLAKVHSKASYQK